MYSPLQSLFIKGSAGDPLPKVWEGLERRGTRFLRGQLGLIVAPPGAGKSAFVLAYVVKSRVSTLYFSADSDSFTQLSRMISIELGWTLEKSSAAVRSMNLGIAAESIEDIPVRFNYSASPTLDMIELELVAYDELYGDYPELVVMDNITNIVTGSSEDDPFAGLESLMDYLHKMARDTGSFVIGLHHVTGQYNDADKPIPLSGVKGQITRVPELVLTMHRAEQFGGPDQLYVSTVKNRAGKADPSGKNFAILEFVGDTMSISDSS